MKWVLFILLIGSHLQARLPDVQELSLEEKIGQILVIPVSPKMGLLHQKEVLHFIEQHHASNLIFMQGDYASQIDWIQYFQSRAKFPLFCVQDAEWGLAMRLEGERRYPSNLTLGAIDDANLIEEVGFSIGRDCKNAGIDLNFAPVVDVNCNPLNPIIHMRSYGEDPENVFLKARALIRGMEKANVWCCAKHFPGHGDTATDSHHALPVITHSWERLQKVELYPFKKLIESSLFAIMVGHLYFTSFAEVNNEPASLSPFVIQSLLREKMQFDGFIFTDALNMRALINGSSLEEVASKAFEAGSDFLLFASEGGTSAFQKLLKEEIPSVIERLKSDFLSNRLSINSLDLRVKKILEMRGCLDKSIPKNVPAISDSLRERLFDAALTLIENPDQILPLKKSSSVALVQTDRDLAFFEALSKYGDVTLFSFSDPFPDTYDAVVISLDQIDPKKMHFGISPEIQSYLSSCRHKRVVLVLFGSPYASIYCSANGARIIAYENDPWAKKVAADLIFGKKSFKGRLPVTLNERHPVNYRLELSR